MRKILCALCALVMAALPTALAEELPEELPMGLEAANVIQPGVPVELDLNGDGITETLNVKVVDLEDEWYVEIVVSAQDGAYCAYKALLARTLGVYALDLDGDGAMEILVTGDEMSDDYCTLCLRYVDGALVPVQFADADRDERNSGYFDDGYGRLIAVDGVKLTMMGSQDVLGTWMASRVFTLRDGRFELDDGGVWLIEDNTNDPDYWEYRSLTAVRDVPVVFEDGAEGAIKPGEQMMITATDRETFAEFITRDGRRGTVQIEPNTVDGWGFTISGEPDYNYFDYIPYSD